jgi:hypothetical protein
MANYDVKGYIKNGNNYLFKDAWARGEIGNINDDIGDLSTTQVTGASVAAQITALNGKIPTVNNGTLIIQRNGTNVTTFSANQSGNATANITVPTALSELTADSTHRLVTDAQITKLNGIAAGAEVNVQSDWNVTDESADDFIKNKPEIPTPGHLYLYTVELYHLNYHFYIKIDIFTPIKYPLPYTTVNRRDKNAILNFIKAYYPTIRVSDSDSEHEYSFDSSTNEIDSILLPTFTSLKKFEYIAINTYSDPHFSIFYRKENDIDHIYSRDLDKMLEYGSPSYFITLVHQFL